MYLNNYLWIIVSTFIYVLRRFAYNTLKLYILIVLEESLYIHVYIN